MHSRISRPVDNHQRRLNLGFITILLLSSFRFLVSRALLSSSPPLLTLQFSEMSASASCQQQCTTSFSDFLASQGSSPCLPSVVIGNEAGDADSIVSALALAYIESLSSSSIVKTPIVSIPRNDLCLRRETVVLLDLANVDTSKLHYIDDGGDDDDEAVLAASPKFVTLVDHNRLTIIGKDWTVTEIVDHHFDEGFHEHVVGDLRNVAFENDRALVASTCTLVAERLFSKVKPPYAADLSIALLGVILLDTVNMQPAAGKGTARDQRAMDTFVSKTDWSSLLLVKGTDLIHPNNGVIDTDKLYDKLSASKFDSDFWEQLSVRDALRLDYKRFEAPTGHVFGSSSVLLDMSALLDKPSFVTETMSYMKELNIPLLAVLGFQRRGPSTQRELLLCGSEERLVNDMADYILTNPEAKAAMQPEEKPLVRDTMGALVVRHFGQGNLKASRKQVAPIMLHFFK